MPATVVLSSDAASRPVATMLASFLRKELGVTATIESRPNEVGIELRTGPVDGIRSPEGYRLTVDGRKISVVAPSPAGVFYGFQTISQLLAEQEPGSATLPRMTIVDEPRFGWRGLHLDVSRHFFTPKEIKLYLDYMAELKLNVFHWHLVDDGGWRMEVKRFPRLTEVGAWRLQRPGEVWNYSNIEFPGRKAGKPLYGGFYTQRQIAEIVRYAAERHITVVPEIEMPGHSLPAVVAYPEVACSGEGGKGTNAFCAGKERTFEFLEQVLDETMKLFPSKVIHIGGDELDKRFWSRCPDCQKRARDEGLTDMNELQSYFIRRIEKYLNSKGRTLIGWDEILEGGLAPNAMVMSWRGVAGGIEASRSGHQVVMSPTSHCYFDYSYDSIPTEKVYSNNPIPDELAGEERDRVLGAQANVWTEWMADFDRVETMIFPRILAMAETLWTRPENKDYSDFVARLNAFYPRFVRRGIDFFMEPPVAEYALQTFDDVCAVRFEAPRIPGVELRYTVDGSAPSARSNLYDGPIAIRENTTVRAALIRGGKTDGKVVEAACLKTNSALAPKSLSVEVYDGRFDLLPDFAKSQPSERRAVDDLLIEPFVNRSSFALRWTGTIRIDHPGPYVFTVGSDDGTRLKIAGATVVDNNAAQGYTERSGRAMLAAGVYEFELAYFQQGGAARMAAFVEGPGMVRGPLRRLVVRP